MNKLNKVPLCAGIIAAITGILSCYAAQNPRAGEIFDSLSSNRPASMPGKSNANTSIDMHKKVI